MIRDQKIQHNTRLGYMYRDAGNWKTWNQVVLIGEMTPEMFAEMQSRCEDGREMFVPEQLGLPLIRDWDVTEDDHSYAELVTFDATNDNPTVDITCEELLERFRKVKGNWRPEDYQPEIEEEDE